MREFEQRLVQRALPKRPPAGSVSVQGKTKYARIPSAAVVAGKIFPLSV